MAPSRITIHPQTGKPKNDRRKKYPSAEELRVLLGYNPCTGQFRWKSRPETNKYNIRDNKRLAGKFAGTKCHGYVNITIGTQYSAHRLAWIWWYGFDPEEEIDHINRIRHDNRISNLRLVDLFAQARNKRVYSNNKSGHRGVSFHKPIGKWRSAIAVNGKKFHIGYYNSKQEAAEAYQRAMAEKWKN